MLNPGKISLEEFRKKRFNHLVILGKLFWRVRTKEIKSCLDKPHGEIMIALAAYMIPEEYRHDWHFPKDFLPDICVTCHTAFTPVRGGNFRAGCCKCLDTSGSINYEIQRLAIYLGLSDAEVVSAFAVALLQVRKNACNFEEYILLKSVVTTCVSKEVQADQVIA